MTRYLRVLLLDMRDAWKLFRFLRRGGNGRLNELPF